MNSSSLRRLLKFGLVGGSGIFVNQGIFMILTHGNRIGVELASPIAIFCAITTNFLLNYHWTWSDRATGELHHIGKGFIKFFTSSSLIALIFNYIPLLIMVKLFGWNKDISNLIGIGCAAGLNFTISHFWTFRSRK